MKIKFYIVTLITVVLCISSSLYAQRKVTVNPSIQRFLGDVSDLERNKFFNLHGSWSDESITDDEYNYLMNDLHVNFGRGFWGPFAWAKNNAGGNVGVYPEDPQTITNKGNGVINYNKNRSVYWRRSNRAIVTEHPQDVIRWSIDTNKAATWAANYLKSFYTDEDRPLWYEPMNEPFVHVNDAEFSTEQPDNAKMRQRVAEWYSAIGKKIDETPELKNVKVIGYSAAWPSMELWDFNHWETRMKMFMDVAGDNMDAFATHLYDGINVTGSDTKRSGCNSEAILDLIETYSHIKWGIVKPHAISEFGGIEKGYPDEFSDVKSVQAIKSINHILFNLLDRENDIEIAIPFITGKALWHINANNNYQPYGSVLWRPKVMGVPVDENTEWVYTPRVYFYELWQDVKGKRVMVSSNDPDIQTQAFVDQNHLYLALSNLEEGTASVNLESFNELDNLSNVRIKRLKIWIDKDPEYTDNTQNTAPTVLNLDQDETVVLDYSFNQDISFDNAIRSTKYYSDQYLQPITGKLNFTINGVDVGTNGGTASLRMSIGRKQNRSKKPTIYINGNALNVPQDWAGGDQASRDDFFGMIEVQVPVEYLQENNSIDIQFPDADGTVSSVVLQVNLLDNKLAVGISDVIKKNIKVYPTLITEGWMKVEMMKNTFQKAEIINTNGAVVKSENIAPDQAELQITGMPSANGMYILRLIGDEGIYTQKVMVAR